MVPVGVALSLPEPDVANGVDDLVDRARDAAAAGVAGIWLGQAGGGDALSALVAVAREVPDVALGTSIMVVYSRHPLTMASQALALQAASHGRFTLGLGTSAPMAIEGRYGYPFDRPARYMREYLSALLPVLRDGEVSFSGDVLRANTAGMPIRVPGADPSPPVLLAAMGPQMLHLAGERADGTIPYLVGPRALGEHIVPSITRAASAADRPAPRIATMVATCVTNDVEDARERAARALAFYEQVPSYRAALDREGAEHAVDVAVIGDEEAVGQQLQQLVDAGSTELVFSTGGGFLTPAERDRTIALAGALSS